MGRMPRSQPENAGRLWTTAALGHEKAAAGAADCGRADAG